MPVQVQPLSVKAKPVFLSYFLLLLIGGPLGAVGHRLKITDLTQIFQPDKGYLGGL